MFESKPIELKTGQKKINRRNRVASCQITILADPPLAERPFVIPTSSGTYLQYTAVRTYFV